MTGIEEVVSKEKLETNSKTKGSVTMLMSSNRYVPYSLESFLIHFLFIFFYLCALNAEL